jgi:hypothetical protein
VDLDCEQVQGVNRAGGRVTGIWGLRWHIRLISFTPLWRRMLHCLNSTGSRHDEHDTNHIADLTKLIAIFPNGTSWPRRQRPVHVVEGKPHPILSVNSSSELTTQSLESLKNLFSVKHGKRDSVIVMESLFGSAIGASTGRPTFRRGEWRPGGGC